MIMIKKKIDPNTDLSFRAPLGRQAASASMICQETASSSSNVVEPILLYKMYLGCHILRLGSEARYSALVFLHRYHIATNTRTQNEHKNNKDLKWVAAACLFLACKTEEQPRRLRDVINLAQMLFSSSESLEDDDGGSGNSSNVNRSGSKKGKLLDDNEMAVATKIIKLQPKLLPDLNQEYWDCKKQIVKTEQDLLRWLSYDTSVSHPHRLVTILLLEGETSSNNQSKLIIPFAFRRLNDGLFFQPALRHPILELAVAAIELAISEIEESGSESEDSKTQGDDTTDNTPSSSCMGTIKTLLDKYYKRYKLSKEDAHQAKQDLEEATKRLKRIAANCSRSSSLSSERPLKKLQRD